MKPAEVEITQGTSSRTVPIVPVAEPLLAVAVRRTAGACGRCARSAERNHCRRWSEARTRKAPFAAAWPRHRSQSPANAPRSAPYGQTPRSASLAHRVHEPGAGPHAPVRRKAARALSEERTSHPPDGDQRRPAQAERRVRPARCRPRDGGTGRRRTFTVRMKAVKVGRELETPISDINGDGHADFLATPETDTDNVYRELLLSTTTGRRRLVSLCWPARSRRSGISTPMGLENSCSTTTGSPSAPRPSAISLPPAPWGVPALCDYGQPPPHPYRSLAGRSPISCSPMR